MRRCGETDMFTVTHAFLNGSKCTAPHGSHKAFVARGSSVFPSVYILKVIFYEWKTLLQLPSTCVSVCNNLVPFLDRNPLFQEYFLKTLNVTQMLRISGIFRTFQGQKNATSKMKCNSLYHMMSFKKGFLAPVFPCRLSDWKRRGLC